MLIVPHEQKFPEHLHMSVIADKMLHILRGIQNCFLFKIVCNLLGKEEYTSEESQTQILQQQSRDVNEWGRSTEQVAICIVCGSHKRAVGLQFQPVTNMASYSKLQKKLEVRLFICNLL